MNNRGMTLMELVITLGLLAIMAAIAIPATSGWRQNAQCKEAAREVLSALRRGRSMAVQQNQNVIVTFDLANHTYDFGGVKSNLPTDIKIEYWKSSDSDWNGTDTPSITFRPQGGAANTITLRINEDDSLQVQVDSLATGLAHM